MFFFLSTQLFADSLSQSQNLSDTAVLLEFFEDIYSTLSILNIENQKNFKLRELFIELNTTIPSSASVERLFLVGKKFWTFDLSNLSDKRLEPMIFLKTN